MKITKISVGSFLIRLATGVWIGKIIFFGAIFAPRVFQILPRPLAGDLQSAIFPAYYAMGLVAGGIIALGAALRFAGGFHLSQKTLVLSATLLVFSMSAYAYSRFGLIPELEALRPAIAEPSVSARFQELHHLSTRLNGGVLLSLLGLLALLG
jgi:hypothetical protein